MNEYAITFARSARRELEALERSLAHRILAQTKIFRFFSDLRRRSSIPRAIRVI